MPGIEAADFDCAGCGATWTAVSTIVPGGIGQLIVACEACGEAMGTMRCDNGQPRVQRRPAHEANLGFVRVYGGDQRLVVARR